MFLVCSGYNAISATGYNHINTIVPLQLLGDTVSPIVCIQKTWFQKNIPLAGRNHEPICGRIRKKTNPIVKHLLP
jgi:hypothetical protein